MPTKNRRFRSVKRNNKHNAVEQSHDGVIVVAPASWTVTRGDGVSILNANKLGGNVREFLQNIHKIICDAPGIVGDFELSEFEVTAEISAEGTLGILGSGVKAAGKGGMTFKFRRHTRDLSES